MRPVLLATHTSAMEVRSDGDQIKKTRTVGSSQECRAAVTIAGDGVVLGDQRLVPPDCLNHTRDDVLEEPSGHFATIISSAFPFFHRRVGG